MYRTCRSLSSGGAGEREDEAMMREWEEGVSATGGGCFSSGMASQAGTVEVVEV